MGLSWNEIKSRALLFSNTWGDAIDQVAQCVLGARTHFADASHVDLHCSFISAR